MTSTVQHQVSISTIAPQPDEIVTAFGVVREGMEVWGRDGKIGRVIRIVHHDHTDKPSHLVVRHGWFGARRLLIPLHWTIDIMDGRINVNLRRDQLQNLAQYRTDEEIAREVHGAIYTSPAFMPHGDCTAIRVLARDGVVTLRGNVRKGQRRFEAQATANGVRGVRHLRNELIADDDLERRVGEAITSDAALSRLDLSVTISLGLVDLQGCVPTAALYEQLIFVLRQVNGVRAICDKLVVGTAANQLGQASSYIPVRQDVQRIANRTESNRALST